MTLVILHIGLHKTGTTTIQRTLGEHRAKLALFGYHYPQFAYKNRQTYNHSSPLLSLYSDAPLDYHMNLREGIDSPEKLEDQNSAFLAQLKSALNSGSTTVILSGEGLSALTPKNISRLKNDLERLSEAPLSFRVVCCVREPISFITSDIQQKVKGGFDLENPYESESKKNYKFCVILKKYINVFGLSSMRVYSFEEAVESSDGLCAFFLKKAVPELDWIPPAEVTINEGISEESVRIISYINRCRPFWVDGKIGADRAPRDLDHLFELQGQKFELDNRRKQMLFELYRSDRRWLRKMFGIECPDEHEVIAEKRDLWNDRTLESLGTIIQKLDEGFASLIVDFLKIEASVYQQDNPDRAHRLIQFCDHYESVKPG